MNIHADRITAVRHNKSVLEMGAFVLCDVVCIVNVFPASDKPSDCLHKANHNQRSSKVLRNLQTLQQHGDDIFDWVFIPFCSELGYREVFPDSLDRDFSNIVHSGKEVTQSLLITYNIFLEAGPLSNAVSVPAPPMALPTLEAASVGTSLTPSPTIATLG
ncbi:hypothetical protein FE784_32345 [Paenibacillus hemerocallicola]|uniref:Uncharacterized protein n=1 Tax=Paenibacillus hemerocallicola TaxID=1172614 RepID=A0A5C4T1I6_9BACL|nr:hypothetical protein [Paenibacillus hemerocallicola]TNJ62117.1 hypothetical protein FE784_32345 [Paenibacillus hemerocallicola]